MTSAGVRSTYTLNLHDASFSPRELILNPKLFPDAAVGMLVHVWTPSSSHKLLLQIHDLSEVRGGLQVSISKFVGRLYGFASMSDVSVAYVKPQTEALDIVEFDVKNQYIGRSDMWRLGMSLKESCVYKAKKLDFYGMRLVVSDLWRNGHEVPNGFITNNTRFVFRSASARFFIFVQLSSEMWQFADDGELYFEKAVNGFFTDLFKRWTDAKYQHTLSLIFFSRTFYHEHPNDGGEALQRDAHGRLYRDFYREVLHEETRSDWLNVLVPLKRAFNSYLSLVPQGETCYNSDAADGNFLEAINLALNCLDRHYIDRDLSLTGRQCIVVTAGSGTFHVWPKLASMSKRRIMDGVGCDVVCVGRPPLHVSPLFCSYPEQDVFSRAVTDHTTVTIHTAAPAEGAGASPASADSIRAAVRGLASAETRRNSVQALGKLALDSAANGDAIREAGGIRPLVECVRSAVHDVKRWAVRALAHLARGNAANRDAVREAGGIEGLVECAKSAPNDVKGSAAVALRHLARGNAPNRDAIREAGGIGPLVEYLRSAPSDVKKQAAAALGNLANNHAVNGDAIREAGGIGPLLECARSGPSDAKPWAAGALRNMAADNAANRDAIRDAGGMPPLEPQTDAGSGSPSPPQLPSSEPAVPASPPDADAVGPRTPILTNVSRFSVPSWFYVCYVNKSSTRSSFASRSHSPSPWRSPRTPSTSDLRSRAMSVFIRDTPSYSSASFNRTDWSFSPLIQLPRLLPHMVVAPSGASIVVPQDAALGRAPLFPSIGPEGHAGALAALMPSSASMGSADAGVRVTGDDHDGAVATAAGGGDGGGGAAAAESAAAAAAVSTMSIASGTSHHASPLTEAMDAGDVADYQPAVDVSTASSLLPSFVMAALHPPNSTTQDFEPQPQPRASSSQSSSVPFPPSPSIGHMSQRQMLSTSYGQAAAPMSDGEDGEEVLRRTASAHGPLQPLSVHPIGMTSLSTSTSSQASSVPGVFGSPSSSVASSTPPQSSVSSASHSAAAAAAAGRHGHHPHASTGSSASPTRRYRSRTVDNATLAPRIALPTFTFSSPVFNSALESSASVNPFSGLSYNRPRMSSSKRRWTALFHQTADASSGVNPAYRGLLAGINWKSLTRPASLPITTDFFPTESLLRSTKYIDHVYFLLLLDDNPYDGNPVYLMRELISQRLVQGYQLVVTGHSTASEYTALPYSGVSSSASPSPPASPFHSTSPSPSSAAVTSLLPQPQEFTSFCYYLSSGQDFHVLSYDPNKASVEVKIYTKRYTSSQPNHAHPTAHHSPHAFVDPDSVAIDYSYMLFSVSVPYGVESVRFYQDSPYEDHPDDEHVQRGKVLHSQLFRPKRVTLKRSKVLQHQWNHTDGLTAGTADPSEFFRLRYWSVRYLILPLKRQKKKKSEHRSPPQQHHQQQQKQQPPQDGDRSTDAVDGDGDGDGGDDRHRRESKERERHESEEQQRIERQLRAFMQWRGWLESYNPVDGNTGGANTTASTPASSTASPAFASKTPSSSSTSTSVNASAASTGNAGTASTATSPVGGGTNGDDGKAHDRATRTLLMSSASNVMTAAAGDLHVPSATVSSTSTTARTMDVQIVSQYHQITVATTTIGDRHTQKINPQHVHDIARRMLVDPGLSIRDRRYRLMKFKNCFVGSEAVDFLMGVVDGVKSRADAVAIGQQLMAHRFIDHVVQRHAFKDGDYFYHFLEHQPAPTAATSASLSSQSPIPASGFKSIRATPSAPNSLPASPKRTASQASSNWARLFIRMETPLEERYEWIYLAHDRVFNPNTPFFFEFEWIVCSGSIVRKFINLALRKARAYGLRLIQIPRDYHQDLNPFFLPMFVPFRPALPSTLRTAFQEAILLFFDFVLMRPYSCDYVHESGSVFVNLQEDGYEWYPCAMNASDASTSSSSSAPTSTGPSGGTKSSPMDSPPHSGGDGGTPGGGPSAASSSSPSSSPSSAYNARAFIRKFQSTCSKYDAYLSGTRSLSPDDSLELTSIMSLLPDQLQQPHHWKEIFSSRFFPLPPPAPMQSKPGSGASSTPASGSSSPSAPSTPESPAAAATSTVAEPSSDEPPSLVPSSPIDVTPQQQQQPSNPDRRRGSADATSNGGVGSPPVVVELPSSQ